MEIETAYFLVPNENCESGFESLLDIFLETNNIDCSLFNSNVLLIVKTLLEQHVFYVCKP